MSDRRIIIAAKGPQGPRGVPGPNTIPTAEAVEDAIDLRVPQKMQTPGDPVHEVLTATYAPVAGLPVVFGTTTELEGAAPRPVEHFDGHLWGTTADGKLHRSTNGTTWTQVGSTPPTRLIRFLPTADGEILGHNGLRIYRSSGWANSPATATWAAVGNAPTSGSTFQAFQFDGDGTKFIIAEYASTRTNSRYVQISLDGGLTWANKWDTNAQFPATAFESHLHGVAYDRWRDRFWLIEGHDTPRGIRYSDDDGDTWTRVTGGLADSLNPCPTVIVPTKRGVVFGSDSRVWSTFGMPNASAADLAVVPLHRWQVDHDGVVGFGQRGWYDESTDTALISFYSAATDSFPLVVAADPFSASVAWTAPDDGLESRVWAAFTLPGGRFIAHSQDPVGVQKTTIGRWAVGARESVSVWDAGNVGGGHAGDLNSSVAVGISASTGGWPDSLAVGTDAKAGVSSNGKATAVGRSASALSSNSVAVGYNARADGSTSVAIGAGSITTAATTVALGYISDATAEGATALGYAATGSGLGSLAAGLGANAGAVGAVALGYSSVSNGAASVAIGHAATTTTVSEATALGAGATAAAAATAVGRSAVAAGGGGVAIGKSAASNAGASVAIGTLTVAGSNSVVIGGSATGGAIDSSTIVGANASTVGAEGTAIGRSAVAGQTGTALGKSANAGLGGTAIGHNTTASHNASVALGTGSATTAASQVRIAARHIEISELAADPAAPAADTARIYVKDDGAGSTILCVRTSAGVKTVAMA